MKKNKAMRLASALLVATLATTCAISGTFAKYTTSTTGSDSARVAKWGFTDTTSKIELTDLFKTAYDKNVQGKADVIAPGTTNSASFAFAYNTTDNGATAPEVAYTFTVSTNGSSCANDIKNNDNIQWKLDEGQWGTWNDMITAIEMLDGDKAQYNAGELPAEFRTNQTHTVAWQWVFSTNDAADATDTAMGNATNLDNVNLTITITATQVD